MRTEAEKNIKYTAECCHKDGKELLELLSKMGVSGKKTMWRSAGAKLISILKKDKVTELKGRLQGYRADLILNLTLLLQ